MEYSHFRHLHFILTCFNFYRSFQCRTGFIWWSYSSRNIRNIFILFKIFSYYIHICYYLLQAYTGIYDYLDVLDKFIQIFCCWAIHCERKSIWRKRLWNNVVEICPLSEQYHVHVWGKLSVNKIHTNIPTRIGL